MEGEDMTPEMFTTGEPRWFAAIPWPSTIPFGYHEYREVRHAMGENTVIDSNRQVMRCNICGEEIPMPYGECHWVVAVMKAFIRAHKGAHGPGSKLTWFSTPKDLP
jgi:hypothetical protein